MLIMKIMRMDVMYLRLIKVPPHVKILTSMGPAGPRFLAFLPRKSSSFCSKYLFVSILNTSRCPVKEQAEVLQLIVWFPNSLFK